jgi:hypothetical protein
MAATLQSAQYNASVAPAAPRVCGEGHFSPVTRRQPADGGVKANKSHYSGVAGSAQFYGDVTLAKNNFKESLIK